MCAMGGAWEQGVFRAKMVGEMEKGNFAPPPADECLAAANSELLQSLDAIGREAWRRDRHALHPLSRVIGQSRVGRRPEPLRAAEFGLERDIDLAAERFPQ